MSILLPLAVCGFVFLGATPCAARAGERERAFHGGAAGVHARGLGGGEGEIPARALEIDPGNVTARNFLRTISAQEAKAGAGGRLEKQLAGVVLDRVELREATFREALDFLKQKAAEKGVAVSFVSAARAGLGGEAGDAGAAPGAVSRGAAVSLRAGGSEVRGGKIRGGHQARGRGGGGGGGAGRSVEHAGEVKAVRGRGEAGLRARRAGVQEAGDEAGPGAALRHADERPGASYAPFCKEIRRREM